MFDSAISKWMNKWAKFSYVYLCAKIITLELDLTQLLQKLNGRIFWLAVYKFATVLWSTELDL